MGVLGGTFFDLSKARKRFSFVLHAVDIKTLLVNNTKLILTNNYL